MKYYNRQYYDTLCHSDDKDSDNEESEEKELDRKAEEVQNNK